MHGDGKILAKFESTLSSHISVNSRNSNIIAMPFAKQVLVSAPLGPTSKTRP